MFHNSQAVLALSKEENPTIFQKTLGVNDFYFSGGEDFEFPLGNIQMVGKSQAPMFRGEKPGETRFAPSWTLRMSPVTRSTSGSRPRTCRGLRTASRSPTTATSRSATRPATRRPRTACTTSSRRCSATWGCTTGTCCRITPTSRTRSRSPAAPTRPARAGSAPTRDSSVLNTDCRAHELDNLYVVDTSFFPSIGAVNPALTAMANAMRVGDHLLDRLSAHQPNRSPPMPDDEYKHRVVIVGGGFAGLGCAQPARRPRRRPRHADRPQQLPPVPAAALPGGYLPARAERHRALAARRVRRPRQRRRAARRDHRRSTRRADRHAADGEPGRGDVLVLAAGSQPNFFGTPGAPEHRFLSTRSTMQLACARASSACSSRSTAIRRWSTAAR